ncbi:hypothetical protein AMECASPLE_027543 [Ameca splendens]|uniref:Uncharacterized protein n=1 Tax=Ameca splendens TaxID=208324 RepID=A0ABV0ZQ42_9TELE
MEPGTPTEKQAETAGGDRIRDNVKCISMKTGGSSREQREPESVYAEGDVENDIGCWCVNQKTIWSRRGRSRGRQLPTDREVLRFYVMFVHLLSNANMAHIKD